MTVTRRCLRLLGGLTAFSVLVGLLAACQPAPGPPQNQTSPTASPSARWPPPSPTASPSAKRTGCPPGDPLRGVNSPSRLILKANCVTVSGIVGCIKTSADDGDTYMELLLDKGQDKYLTSANRKWTCSSDQGSDTAPRLHVEVIPQHCKVLFENCADDYPWKDPKIPRNGQHISVTGAWVLDRAHFRGYTRWAEIHPAFRIVIDR